MAGRTMAGRAMARWILSAARIVAACALGAMGVGCAVGAGPGATHDDLHDGDDTGIEETEAYGLFDADPTDSAREDTGSPSEASPPVEVGADAAPIDTAPIDAGPPDRCAAKSDGAYCATRFSGSGLDVHDLVHCVAGKTSSVDSCVAGCFDGATGADKCHADPCVTASIGGPYCGQSTQYGFGGGITDWLYDCESGKTKSSTPCAAGCIVEPPGTSDKCR